jgi:hypothetical protein
MKKHQTSKHRTLTEGRYTVTMLDDVNTTTHASDVAVYHAPRDVSVPSLCEGFHLPNRFRVDGLNDVVEMTIDVMTRNGRHVFACTSLTVLPAKNTSGLNMVERIPVATLVKLAVKCARIVCVYYPAHYEGDVLDHNLRAVNATRRVGATPYVEPVKLSPPKGTTWTDDAVNKLIGKPPRLPNNKVTDEELRKVADVYNTAKKAGGFPTQAVIAMGYSDRTADNRVRACKDKGFIPSTKKRATK